MFYVLLMIVIWPMQVDGGVEGDDVMDYVRVYFVNPKYPSRTYISL